MSSFKYIMVKKALNIMLFDEEIVVRQGFWEFLIIFEC